MKSIYLSVKILIVVSIVSCSFKSIKPSITKERLSVSCDQLIPIVKDKWKQHRKLKYYKYDEEIITKLQKDYKECLMTLKKEGIIELLGQPTENLEDDYIFYALNKGCTDVSPHDCNILTFHFREESGKLFAIQVQDYVALTNNK